MTFEKKIEKEQLESLEMKSYEGKIILIEKDKDLEEAVNKLSQYPILGFDTETRPSFKKGQRYQTALLQLASDDEVYLFQMKKLKRFKQLQKLLNRKDILKVGAAIHDDVRKLNHYFPLKRDSFLELQELVKKYGVEDISLKKMTAIILGFRISKGQQVSNWEAEPLEEAQIKYAATDAWVSLLIYQELNKYPQVKI